MADKSALERLLLDHLELIERVVASLCRRKHCRDEETEEFGSWVKLRLIEDDYAILRKFRGQAGLATYLNTVIHNLFRDFRTSRWGKWRPSAAAERLGPIAVQLETLTSRDGHTYEEATEILLSSLGAVASRDHLEALAAELPLRPKRRLEPLDLADPSTGATAEDLVRRGELGAVQGRAERALAVAMKDLDGEERLLLKMRFEEGLTVAQIARTLDFAQRPLYSRFERALRHLRAELERQGVSAEQIRELLAWPELGVKVDYGWEKLVERPSNLAEESG